MLTYAEDINKIVRMDYGDDVIYQNLATEALPIWRQWNEEAKEDGRAPVYNETGVLYFCRDGKFSEYERRSIQRVRAAGYGDAIEEFTTPESIVERFPQFADSVANGFNVAYLNKYAGQLITKDVVHSMVVQSENRMPMLTLQCFILGWCHSSGAVVHVYKKCLRNGVTIHQAGTHSTLKELIMESGSGLVKGIRTADGKEHFADLVILTTGAWTASLVDMEGTLTATGHAVIHFKPEELAMSYFGEGFPVWTADISHLGKSTHNILPKHESATDF